MKRRPVSPFSLSFLDIMFCGFGAVVLLVLILNADTVNARNERFADLRAEVVRVEKELLTGKRHYIEARNALEAAEEEKVTTEGRTIEVMRELRELEAEIARMESSTLASKAHINRLSSDLKDLDAEKKRLGAPIADKRDDGKAVRRFTGDGDRQYLTGLKIGGQRILILVDASASMLDETIVNIIRRRNMNDSRKREAPKWRRTLSTAEWVLSNMPPDAKFQIYRFNTQVEATLPDSEGRWLNASSRQDTEGAIGGLRAATPGGGTSLHRAFDVVQKLSPRPDNIILVTDGLPTQGRRKPGSTTVSAKERLGYFLQAMQSLPGGIPVNTILLPMEGDAPAAAAFWKLALNTRGSFITPARDWP